MKIVTASNGKKVLKLSKAEWMNLGKKAGWVRKAQSDNIEDSITPPPSSPSSPSSIKKPSWLDVDDRTAEQITMLKRFIKALKLHAPKKIQTNIHFEELGDNQFELEIDIPGDPKVKMTGNVGSILREVRNLARRYNITHLLSGTSLSPSSYSDEDITKVLNRGTKTSPTGTTTPGVTSDPLQLDKPKRGRPRKNPIVTAPEEIDDGTEFKPKTIKELEQEVLDKLNKNQYE